MVLSHFFGIDLPGWVIAFRCSDSLQAKALPNLSNALSKYIIGL